MPILKKAVVHDVITNPTRLSDAYKKELAEMGTEELLI